MKENSYPSFEHLPMSLNAEDISKVLNISIGNAYNLPSPNERALMKIFREICSTHGIMSTPDECFRYLNELPAKDVQISMFG